MADIDTSTLETGLYMDSQDSLPSPPPEEDEIPAPAPKLLSRLPTAGSRLPLPGTRLPVPRKASNSNLSQTSAIPSISRASSIQPPSQSIPTLNTSKSRDTLRRPSATSNTATRKPSIPTLQTKLSSSSLRSLSSTSPSFLPLSPSLRSPADSAATKTPVKKASRYSVNGKVERNGTAAGNGSFITSPTSPQASLTIKTLPGNGRRNVSAAAAPFASSTSSRMKPPSRVSIGSTLSPTSPRPLKTPARSFSVQKPTGQLVQNGPSAAPAQNGSLAVKKTRAGASTTPLKKPAPRLPPPDSPDEKKLGSVSASLTLREQIAKAKAARKASANVSQPPDIEIMMPGVVIDEANLYTENIGISIGGTNTGLLKGRIKSARSDGRLNISNMELKEIPEIVWKMYDFEAQDNADSENWFENVDLTRFVATDNELESVGEEMAAQFGGLTTIDLRNNALTAIPRNLPELAMITSLNLSNNKLTNAVLEIITQMSTLVILDLSKNQFSELPNKIASLVALEALELNGNNMRTLPDSINSMPKLKVLNISSNKLEFLPYLANSPLVELYVASNNLAGPLFPQSVTGLKSLQILDVKHNQLTSLSENETFLLPSIRQILASNNRLVSLPSLEGCPELLKLFLDCNKLKELPAGTIKLHKLRNLDISSNNISYLDPHLGLLDALDVLKIDGNPIPHRRLAGLNAIELKKNLRSRLEPEEVEEEYVDAAEEIGMNDIFDSGVPEPKLQLKQGGVLDLQHKKLTELSEGDVDGITSSAVMTFWLQHNALTTFPDVLSEFKNVSTLDLSHNALRGEDYFTTHLTFPFLTNLIMHTNTITSLDSLSTYLTLPKIYLIDVHVNRLSALPKDLVKTFPTLASFIASDNKIEELDVDSVDGLKVLDLSNNSLTTLPAKLGAVVGMRELRVEGNLFKVPRRQLLEKGTEAVLAWLKDRIPVDENSRGGDGGEMEVE